MPPRINIPPVSRVLLITLGLQSLLSAAIRYRQWTANSEIVIPYLNLIPQLSLVYPWTFLTTTLVESNVFTFSIACLTLYHGGRYLERAWSSREFAKFLLVVALIPNTLCFATMVIFFTFTRDERWTLTSIGGTIPLQISFLVAFSQLVPAHTVTLFRGILSLRVPRFPLLYVGLVFLLSLTPMLTAASFLLSVYGLVTSWTYLRFYKPVFPDLMDPSTANQASSLRGDASETFAFAEFFPGPVRPFVAAVSDQIFDILVAMRVCTPFSAAAARGGDGYHQHGGHHHGAHRGAGAPGSARAEAERRRALALKALDQRLHAATANAASRSTAAPTPSAAAASAPAATGPTVQTQPSAGGQKAMTTPAAAASAAPSGLLGETNYNPDGEGEGGRS
ncbi:rhomboid-like protein 19 [Rhypophila decipiens]